MDVIGITDGHPGRYDVAIEYDASNSYGVPIRDFRLCSFPLKNGYPDTTGYIDFDSEADGAANAAGTIIDNDSSYSIAPGDKRPSSVQPEKGGEMESAPAGEENWVENNA